MNWKTNKINVAIQDLPEADGILKYDLVDKAIEAIQVSGFKYKVCPFETVIECAYNELSDLIEKVHEACETAGTQRMLMNLKIQTSFEGDVAIEDKMEKYS